MIVADTSGLLALFNRREPAHDAVRTIVEAEDEPLVVSPFVVAELDHLVSTRLGVIAELDALSELSNGAFDLATFTTDQLARAHDVIARYRDQEIGITDASVVVLADHYRTRRVLTLDRRHFDVLRPISGGRFSIHP